MAFGAYAFCVNALKGATLISTFTFTCIKIRNAGLCQCPERGDPHFYNEVETKYKTFRNIVSMP